MVSEHPADPRDPRPTILLNLVPHARAQRIYVRDIAFVCGVTEKTVRAWFSRADWRREPSLTHLAVMLDLLGLELAQTAARRAFEGEWKGSPPLELRGWRKELSDEVDDWLLMDDRRVSGVDGGRWDGPAV